MSRLEISGYVQIVVGIVGIALTILTAPALLDAIGQFAGSNALPAEFSGVSGAIRIFAVILILCVLVLLVALGLATTLSTLVKALGANHPMLASLFGVFGLIGLAVTLTLGILGSSLWIPGFVGALGLSILAFVACGDDTKLQRVNLVAVTSAILFLGTGLVNVIASSVANEHVLPENNPINSSGVGSNQTSSTSRP